MSSTLHATRIGLDVTKEFDGSRTFFVHRVVARRRENEKEVPQIRIWSGASIDPLSPCSSSTNRFTAGAASMIWTVRACLAM